MSSNTEPKPLHFHIFGTKIHTSLSPTIHTAAFHHHNLPHTYTITECPSLSSVAHIITSPSFGGASVTMPHKLTAFQWCTEVSEAAGVVGAVNTLILLVSSGEGARIRIRGENTDCMGLYSLINEYQAISQDGNQGEGKKTGLVIGAGGAARAAVYALIQAGFSTVVIWNRTIEKADKILKDFSWLVEGRRVEMRAITTVQELRAMGVNMNVDVVIGTIPGDVKTEEDFEGVFGARKGLCVEMAYRPKVTPLMKVAVRKGWVVQDGLEVLLRQAFEQYRLWTGREVPEGVMRGAIGRRAPSENEMRATV
ncbi:NAD(P)-binding protein [Aspergillus sclerotioniger CBS 115572]|uniref:NAD(P)-binding protein n=1 Tax=Aspergillus sclerotioniger CBS 115572 TaxID=1450535 RepID=A0A317WKV9_9EURO|nr:NAD(P)-binding protein [Aspergillus sclerotioniger CBS 115572]PWY87136.1 NAD(P)-binding protein [Aspergillus sclerotioniger CBS 115572]